MAVLRGLVPVATDNCTVPSATAHETRISLLRGNDGYSQYPRTHDPGPAPVRWAPSQTPISRRSDVAVIPPPLRTQVRDAIRRAWDQAIADGAFARGRGRRQPTRGRGRTPVRSGARRPRQQSGAQVGAPLPQAAARDRDVARRKTRARHRHRGFVLAGRGGRGRAAGLPERPDQAGRVRGGGRWHPRRARALGSGRADRAPRGQRGIRVSQPDRTAYGRKRTRGLHRRPVEPRPRGRRAARDARVLLQRRRRSDPEPRRVDRRDPTRRGHPRRWLPRRVRRGARVGRAGRRVGGGDGGRGRLRGESSATGLPASSARASRRVSSASASTSTSGRPRRPCTRAAGSSAPSSDSGSAGTSTRRTARSGSARPTSATTRIGSSTGPTASRPTSRPTSGT